jgi:hypothetical protein
MLNVMLATPCDTKPIDAWEKSTLIGIETTPFKPNAPDAVGDRDNPDTIAMPPGLMAKE